MKQITETTPEKLRGGFYTAPHIVDFCLDRVQDLAGGCPSRWLEPAAGDGAFIKGIARRGLQKGKANLYIEAVEVDSGEAIKAATVLQDNRLPGRVSPQCFFEWATLCGSEFDAVVGNPPFVRFQFIGARERSIAERLVNAIGISLRGVSNLWLAFALISLSRLRPGGAFSLVLPSESLATVSAAQFREFLVRNFADIHVDLFPRNTFPHLLQDVLVISGRRTLRLAEMRTIRFCEHRSSTVTTWRHAVEASQPSWMKYLLGTEEHDAFVHASSLAGVQALGGVARMEVSIVTGANSFFTIDDLTVGRYELQPWAMPLLARTSDSPGLIYTCMDHRRACESGSRAWILDFAASKPTPNGHGGVSHYLKLGEDLGLHRRYKCRIRNPWYRVPSIRSGTLMMTKRAHRCHRLIINAARAYTTDTIYRGEMRAGFSGRENDLVAVFQNTLTALSAELEGRTYGGGVLELVPSEISRLRVPMVPTGRLLGECDDLSRRVGGQQDGSFAVMQRVDRFLCGAVPGYRECLPMLRSGLERLQQRRKLG